MFEACRNAETTLTLTLTLTLVSRLSAAKQPIYRPDISGRQRTLAA